MSSSGGQPRETPKKLPPTIFMRCTILRLSWSQPKPGITPSHYKKKNSSKIFRFTQQQTNSEYIFLSLKREIYHYGRILFVSKAPEAILETQNLLHTVNFQWEYSLQNYTWQSRNWSPSEVYKHHHKNRIIALSMCLMNCCKSWILFCNFLLLSLYVQGI
jgi:hypothetical protein